MNAKVYLTTEAREAMNDLPLPILRRVNRVLERLERWPEVSGAKPLTGPLAGWYRVRTGDYRVQFRVAGTRIIVARIGHRDGFYEG
jgi:mRNA-degrading endonuclease RelE of RelBE toxin-antitoxin system